MAQLSKIEENIIYKYKIFLNYNTFQIPPLPTVDNYFGKFARKIYYGIISGISLEQFGKVGQIYIRRPTFSFPYANV
jgi:hypothetical protein